MKRLPLWTCCAAVTVCAMWPTAMNSYAQTSTYFVDTPPAFSRSDPCAGTGAVGSSSSGSCQLRQRTLIRGIARPPDLSGLDRMERLRFEQACASDINRRDSIHVACLRRQLGVQGYDPTVPIRPLPETYRKPVPLPKK
jgi:hypothetical protein